MLEKFNSIIRIARLLIVCLFLFGTAQAAIFTVQSISDTLSTATKAGNSTNIQGSLNSTPSTAFTIDFYSNTACDSSGNGEGEIYIGSTVATTDAGGDVSFNSTIPSQVALGRFITSTATRIVAPLDTSEFSGCVAVIANQGNLTSSAAAYSVNEGNATKTIVVNRTGGSGGTITVNYATSNGTATGETLTFLSASAQTSKTVTVAVNGDLVVELNETFFVNLSNPTNAAFGDNQGLGTILDDDNAGNFSFSSAPYSGVENNQVTVEARTNQFGYYNFAEVRAGATYIFTVTHKHYEFAAQVVFVAEDRDDFNFVSLSKSSLGTAGF